METHKFKMILRESMITVFCALLFTQGSDGVFDIKPLSRLSFHLPLLFLMDNPMLCSKCSDFIVYNRVDGSKFFMGGHD